MTGFRDDAGVVAAARQHEGHVGVGQPVQLVDRPPWRDVILDGAQNEHGCADIGQSDRTAIDLIAPFGQIIVQEQPATGTPNACDRASVSGRHSRPSDRSSARVRP